MKPTKLTSSSRQDLYEVIIHSLHGGHFPERNHHNFSSTANANTTTTSTFMLKQIKRQRLSGDAREISSGGKWHLVGTCIWWEMASRGKWHLVGNGIRREMASGGEGV